MGRRGGYGLPLLADGENCDDRPRRHRARWWDDQEWQGLDYNKSLFHTPDGCGLPIGNLTSQLLSNVYLNEFDQYIETGAEVQGITGDSGRCLRGELRQGWLLSIIDPIDEYLRSRLHLEIHRGKTHLHEVSRRGFLGGFILLPGRTADRAAVLRLLLKHEGMAQPNYTAASTPCLV